MGGVGKWHFLLIYSYIYADIGGWAYNKAKNMLTKYLNGPLPKGERGILIIKIIDAKSLNLSQHLIASMPTQNTQPHFFIVIR